MEMDFIALDYDYFDFEGRNYVRVFGRNSSGKRVCVIDDCDVYFWAILKKGLGERKVNKIIKEVKKVRVEEGARVASVDKVELCDKKYLGKSVRALKIFVSNHKDMKKIAGQLGIDGIELRREHDLTYITRYILEKNLVPMNWYEIKGGVLDGSSEFGGISESLDVDFCIRLEEIKKIDSKKDFIPKVVAFDIETEEFEIGKGEIFMISLVSDDFKKVLSCKSCSHLPDFVECFENEGEMLGAFVKYIKEISPDILTGYYSDGFDLPYIRARAQKNKVKLDLGLDGSAPRFSGGRVPRGKIKGIVHVDLLQFISSAYSQYLQSETLSLNEVSSELLGEKKLDFEFKPSSAMKNKDWQSFFKYNLQDSVLTYKLFMKAWPDIIEFSRIMQEPLFDVSRNGMATNVEDYIVHNLSKYNEIIEKKPTYEMIGERRAMGKYEGAFVLEPIPKLYENIAMFDFTSMYASVIVSYNLSLSTHLGGDKFSKQKGFFPEMLEQVVEFRKKYKAEFKKDPSAILRARSNAFKLLANAAYGYQGFFGARYYCREAAAATAALAKKSILDVIKKIKKQGYEVIYSDTDSIAFFLGKKTKKQALDFLEKLNSQLPGIMELELEDFYKRGLWVTTRGGKIGAKKKYALINEKNKIKIRGFETVRRDWCKLARELQNNVLKMILEDGNEKQALEYVKKIVKNVKERKIDKKKLIIKTQLKKPLSEYKANTPHITIAKKMLEQELPVNQGMLIEYFIAEVADKKALTRERAAFPDDSRKYDIDYYLDKQVLPAIENIFAVFDVDVGAVVSGKNQTTLEGF